MPRILEVAAVMTLYLSVVPLAHAQATAVWPNVGARLIRVEETAASPASDIATGACATRLRDARTGREYVVRHSTVRTDVAERAAGATTSTTTTLRRAVGEYARVELKGDTLSTRIVRVDCLSSRVVGARRGGG